MTSGESTEDRVAGRPPWQEQGWGLCRGTGQVPGAQNAGTGEYVAPWPELQGHPYPEPVF